MVLQFYFNFQDVAVFLANAVDINAMVNKICVKKRKICRFIALNSTSAYFMSIILNYTTLNTYIINITQTIFAFFYRFIPINHFFLASVIL